MDPVTASLILGGLGGLFSGLGGRGASKRQEKESRYNRQEQARQFNMRHQLDTAANLRDQQVHDRRQSSIAQTSPHRQAIVAALMAKLGLGDPAAMGGAMPNDAIGQILAKRFGMGGG